MESVFNIEPVDPAGVSMGIRFIDLHEDLAFSSQFANVIKETEQSSIESLAKYENPVVFSVVFPHIGVWNDNNLQFADKTPDGPSRMTAPLMQVLLEQIKFYHYLERSGYADIVRSKGDLDRKKLKLLIALEGTDVLTDPFDAYLLKDLGVRSIGLTWNYDTKFAASCMSKKDYGLTGYGEELIRICNETGVAVDLGHASKNTIIETSEISKKPVIVSHTNPSAKTDHRRNIDDETIESVVKNGGIVGVTAIVSTLGNNPDIRTMAESMSYIGEHFGWDHVALGSDFLGTTKTPEGFSRIENVKELSDLLGEHSEQVLWGNAYRVLKEILD